MPKKNNIFGISWEQGWGSTTYTMHDIVQALCLPNISPMPTGSLFRRILYPTLGVTLVGGTFYLSLAQNRAEVKDKLKIIFAGFFNTATRGSGAKGRSVGNENSTAADSKER